MPANGSNTRLRSARPAISVAGQDYPALANALLTMLIEEKENGIYRCEASFGNWGSVGRSVGFLYFDRTTLDFGKAFQVKLGNDLIFDGRISGLEANFPQGAPPQISVLAEDRLQDLRMTRRSRSFTDMSDADVMSRIAGDHGLSPQIDVSGPTHKVLAQVNQSDLAFLRERARLMDAALWVEGTTLKAQSCGQSSNQALRMNYGSTLLEFSVLADLAGQCTALSVSGWDVAGKSALNHEATDSIISGELDGNASGASVLASAFGERKEAVVHTVPLDSEETQNQAEALFRSTARRFLTGRGAAQTDSRLRVGNQVDLQGLGPLFSGKYYLAEVRHIFDGVQGIRTEFSAERPGLGRP